MTDANIAPPILDAIDYWNPCTQSLKILPHWNVDYVDTNWDSDSEDEGDDSSGDFTLIYGFGYDAKIKDYKVFSELCLPRVDLAEDIDKIICNIEICELGGYLALVCEFGDRFHTPHVYHEVLELETSVDHVESESQSPSHLNDDGSEATMRGRGDDGGVDRSDDGRVVIDGGAEGRHGARGDDDDDDGAATSGDDGGKRGRDGGEEGTGSGQLAREKWKRVDDDEDDDEVYLSIQEGKGGGLTATAVAAAAVGGGAPLGSPILAGGRRGGGAQWWRA
ncbi:hypothetical protein Sjap_024949 [Stephania japonica]|uniref:Uncharacterized protein n=1 Tax=Stephania japonica TaxID=461633 RepID=A0AAP0EJ89_9MAGN